MVAKQVSVGTRIGIEINGARTCILIQCEETRYGTQARAVLNVAEAERFLAELREKIDTLKTEKPL
jgi:hypothetical protein